MDNNLISSNNNFLTQAFEESFKFHYIDGRISHVRSPYADHYWPAWPASVVSCLEQGEAEITFRQNNHVYRTKGNSAFAMAPGTVYHPRILSPEGAVFTWVHVKFEILGTIDILDFYQTPIVIHDKTDIAKIANLNKQLIKLHELQSSSSIADSLDKKITGYRLLQLLLKYAIPKNNLDKQLFNCRRLKGLLDVIRNNYRDNWTIEKMMKLTNISRPQLHKLFKSSVGKSPLDYVISLRMLEAQRLLITSDLTVAETAAAVGYDDPFYFSKRFKSLFGVSPSKYTGHLLL